MTIFLSILCVFLFLVAAVSVYYMIKFVRIIMILEDDFSDAIDSLTEVENTIEKVLGMNMFFESKEVKIAVSEVLAEIKQGKLAVNRLIQKFVNRSKQKYVVVREDEDPYEEIKQKILRDKRLREIGGDDNVFSEKS